MKKFVFLSIAGFFCFFSLSAKDIPGQIIFENDSMNVTFSIRVGLFSQEPFYERLQFKIKYYDSTHVKVVLKPDQAKEIRFQYDDEDIRMLSRKNSIGAGGLFYTGTAIFLRLEIDGYLKLFEYYYTQHTGGSYNAATGGWNAGASYTVERNLIQKGDDGELVFPGGLFFKDDMCEYFSDCPDLAQKIRDKEFKRGNVIDIVKYYNENCAR